MELAQFVDVLLPLPIPYLYTYRVAEGVERPPELGCRVIVQFGQKKIYTGVVLKTHAQPPKKYEAKTLLEVLDETPILNPYQLKLIKWVANYYLCTQGDVLQAALPSGLKLTSQSQLQLNPMFDKAKSTYEFSDQEELILEALESRSVLSYTEVQDLLGIKSYSGHIKSLVQKDAVLIFEEVKEKFKPKLIKKIRLTEAYTDPKNLEHLGKSLAKAPGQEDILMAYLQEVPVYKNPSLNVKGLEKSSLLKRKDLSDSSLRTLIKNGVFEPFEEIQSRLQSHVQNLDSHSLELSEAQKEAFDQIVSSFQEKDISLLQGVTGSGKTQLYIKLIQEVIDGGSQALLLLPEIALTTQLVERVKGYFGPELGVYHSKYSDNERVEVWQKILQGEYSVILGVRSALFLPFDRLGLIIVDEEHELSYKQQEPAPRYHARDTAAVLASMHKAKLLLGSATPSMESYYHAKKGKFGHILLSERYGEAQLPQIELVNLTPFHKKKSMKGHFSPPLFEALEDTVENKKQGIVFQNRRGYSPRIQCSTCGHIPHCENCSVSLTYHLYSNKLICHLCGYKVGMPKQCEACGSTELRTIGVGTEKLEEELVLLFPKAKIQRMDMDTTRGKFSYQNLLEKFEKREVDIMVGTQMITKGLDFEHLELVGIADADALLYYSDFRAAERAFQLMVQVAGRAGRKSGDGKVFIQTFRPGLPFYQFILNHDYENFAYHELIERKTFQYPPYKRLIRIVFKMKDAKACEKAALEYRNLMGEKIQSDWILGPSEPSVSKVKNWYIREIYLKIPRDYPYLSTLKKWLMACYVEIKKGPGKSTLLLFFDVDP